MTFANYEIEKENDKSWFRLDFDFVTFYNSVILIKIEIKLF